MTKKINREKLKTEMLAIPIHQPYTWFILNGHKDIENRIRKIAAKSLDQRVAIFVCATKLTNKAYEEFVEECEHLGIKKYPQKMKVVSMKGQRTPWRITL